jgi:hypothetical protein
MPKPQYLAFPREIGIGRPLKRTSTGTEHGYRRCMTGILDGHTADPKALNHTPTLHTFSHHHAFFYSQARLDRVMKAILTYPPKLWEHETRLHKIEYPVLNGMSK